MAIGGEFLTNLPMKVGECDSDSDSDSDSDIYFATT